MRDRQDARAAGAEERVGHLARDAVEARCQHRHADAVDVRARVVRHCFPHAPTSMTRLPETSRTARAPGIDDDRGEARFDDRRPDDLGARRDRLEAVDLDRRASPSLQGSEPAAVGASTPPSTGLTRPGSDRPIRQRTSAFQPTVSIGEAGSLTAKTSWWVRWKSASSPATSAGRAETRNPQRHFDLPGLVGIARLGRPVDRAAAHRAGTGERLAALLPAGRGPRSPRRRRSRRSSLWNMAW